MHFFKRRSEGQPTADVHAGRGFSLLRRPSSLMQIETIGFRKRLRPCRMTGSGRPATVASVGSGASQIVRRLSAVVNHFAIGSHRPSPVFRPRRNRTLLFCNSARSFGSEESLPRLSALIRMLVPHQSDIGATGVLYCLHNFCHRLIRYRLGGRNNVNPCGLALA